MCLLDVACRCWIFPPLQLETCDYPLTLGCLSFPFCCVWIENCPWSRLGGCNNESLHTTLKVSHPLQNKSRWFDAEVRSHTPCWQWADAISLWSWFIKNICICTVKQSSRFPPSGGWEFCVLPGILDVARRHKAESVGSSSIIQQQKDKHMLPFALPFFRRLVLRVS